MSTDLFVMSYDSDDDAIQTLANYHQTTIENIRKKWNSLLKICHEYYISKNQVMFLWAINGCLGTNDINIELPTFKIYFYHRTGSNGELAWFSAGLLNSRDGIRKFSENIRTFYPDIDFSGYEELMLSKDLEKHSFAASKQESESVGPFAFYRLKDAKNEKKHFYNLSEIFYDVAHKEKFYTLLLSRLQPTVVKFWVEKPIAYLDHCICQYWLSLLMDQEAGPDVGRGRNIPYENIDKIILLDKKKDENQCVLTTNP